MDRRIRAATRDDVPVILAFIRELSVYEKLAHEVVATEELLTSHLFGAVPAAEVILAEEGGRATGFALFFTNFSTFLGRPGIHLEDLYVREEDRGRGFGKAMLLWLAAETTRRGFGRLEWNVLDWNEAAIAFYRSLGASAMEGWTTFRVTGEALARLGAAGGEA